VSRFENLARRNYTGLYTKYTRERKGEGMYAQTVAHAGAVKAKGEEGGALTRILPGSHSLCTRSVEY